MDIVIDASSLERLGAKCQIASARTPALLAFRLEKMAPLVETLGTNAIADETPVATGRLAESTEADTTLEGLGLTVAIRQPAENEAGEQYAKYVIGGHGPIEPVNAKALHWVSGGQDVFAMHVRAVAPNPYPERAQPEIEEGVTEILYAWSVQTSVEILAPVHTP